MDAKSLTHLIAITMESNELEPAVEAPSEEVVEEVAAVEEAPSAPAVEEVAPVSEEAAV